LKHSVVSLLVSDMFTYARKQHSTDLLHGQVDQLFEVFFEVACLQPRSTTILVSLQLRLFQLSNVYITTEVLSLKRSIYPIERLPKIGFQSHTFSDCSKMSLPKRSAPYWSNPSFLVFLTFGQSGAQS